MGRLVDRHNKMASLCHRRKSFGRGSNCILVLSLAVPYLPAVVGNVAHYSPMKSASMVLEMLRGTSFLSFGDDRTAMLESGSEVQGMGTADKALQQIIHARDIEMEHRAEHVEAKMKEMVTEPWATMHPQRLERAQKRDEMLVKQAEQQAKEDERLLQRTQGVSERDKHLLSVAQARKSLMLSSPSSSSPSSSSSSSSSAAAVHQSTFPPPSSVPSHPPRIPSQAIKDEHAGARRGPAGSAERGEEGRDGRGGAGGGGMGAKFEAVHRKAMAMRRIGEKHDGVYADLPAARAHHTVETLPYILPPVGVAVLLLLFAVTYSVKQWHKIPNGVSWVRRQTAKDLAGEVGEQGERESGMEWRELEHSAL